MERVTPPDLRGALGSVVMGPHLAANGGHVLSTVGSHSTRQPHRTNRDAARTAARGQSRDFAAFGVAVHGRGWPAVAPRAGRTRSSRKRTVDPQPREAARRPSLVRLWSVSA